LAFVTSPHNEAKSTFQKRSSSDKKKMVEEFAVVIKESTDISTDLIGLICTYLDNLFLGKKKQTFPAPKHPSWARSRMFTISAFMACQKEEEEVLVLKS